MRIVIDYDSIWQTSFLDGDPNKPISKKANARKFIATSSTRGEQPAPITNNTIMGVLCRLIGDQRKLYQARNSENYFFSELEKKVSWKSKKENSNNELLYLSNKSDDRCGQGTWMGVIPDDSPWFFSDISPLLWFVLYLDRDEIINFIVSEKENYPMDFPTSNCQPKSLLKRIEQITDIKSEFGKPWKNSERLKSDLLRLEGFLIKEQEKKSDFVDNSSKKPPKTEKQRIARDKKLSTYAHKIDNYRKDIAALGSIEDIHKKENILTNAVDFIRDIFPDQEYWKDGLLYPYRVYSAALYIQARELLEAGYDCNFLLSKSEEIQIQGFSKRGFNGVRDWLNPMTGGRKKAVGTPCQIQKKSGQIEIHIDVERKKGEEILKMIESAGVSSFYLGKKGLAYVSDIRI